MTIPRANQSDADLAASFAKMADLFAQLQENYPQVDTLSMGMSADIQQAIHSGSTLVRVGTGVFGRRAQK
jgi:uncharacterized pyridoxal phosphate-containing UPF0001 family protein